MPNPTRFVRRFSPVLLAVLSAAGPAWADAKSAGTVTGKTVDTAGRANESVEVTIYNGDKKLTSGYSDADGKFTLTDVPPGKGYTIVAVRKVRVTSLTGKKADVTVKKGETTDVGNIELQLGNPE